MENFNKIGIADLKTNELIEIEGGFHWLVVFAAGYVAGEILEGIQRGISKPCEVPCEAAC